MSLLSFSLLLLVAFLLWRLRRTRRIVSQVVEAAERADPVLLEQCDGLIEGFKLDRLVRSFNRLITEKASITDTGQGYLDQIRTTLGNLREAVVMVDQENLIRLANPAFHELVGAHEDPMGKRLDTFLQGAAFHQFLQEVRQGGVGQRKEIEVQVMQKGFWLEVSAANLQEKPAAGGPLTLFFFHDITRQKRLERMRTEFVANVSHELRTPVTVIKGFAETLIEDDAVLTSEEKVRFLEKIRSNAERQHNILQDLLLLSRLESTEMVLEKEEIPLSEFLEDLADTWDPLLEEEGKTLHREFQEGDDRVLIDPLRISQVVSNLFENVLRHAGEFTEVRMGTYIEPGGVRFFLEDDGEGIPEKDLPHIFQRFYRVDRGRSREIGGTGLGLSIVKHIVVQHGGEIEAYSSKGKGARIEVLLPLLGADPESASGSGESPGRERNVVGE